MNLSKIIFYGLVSFLLCFNLSPLGEEEDVIEERVSVVNIEVPVRVFFKGKPVDNLTKQDFEIYEGQKKRSIHGFYIKKKKIKIAGINGSPANEIISPRYFVLVFHIREYNEHLEKGINYIFEKMIRKDDQLTVLAVDKTLFFNNLINKEKVFNQIIELLKTEAQNARKRLFKLKNQVRGIPVFGTLTQDPSTSKEDALDDIFEKSFDYLIRYQRVFQNYKKKYLIPEMTSFYDFAKHLNSVKRDKWVISFYQEENYPHLGPDQKRWILDIIYRLMSGNGHIATYSQILDKLFRDLELELNVASSFAAEDVNKFFTRTDATFHSILIPTINAGSFQFSSGFDQLGFEFKRISTDFENSLRNLTKKTGGTLIQSRNLVSSLKKIEEKEDICYWLTFYPQNPNKTEKITVKVKEKGYRLVYDNNLYPEYLKHFLENQKLLLKKATFSENNLILEISGFKIDGSGDEKTGKLSIRIQVKDSQNKNIYKQEKILSAEKKSIRICVPFNWLPRGKYYLTIDATDLISGKSLSKFLSPNIRPK